MQTFIKVLSASGPKYIRTSDIVSIEVDNNSAIDWYVKATFVGTIGSYAVIDGVTTAVDAHELAHELASSLGLIDPEVFKS